MSRHEKRVKVCQKEIALAVIHPNLLRAAAVRLPSLKNSPKAEIESAEDGVMLNGSKTVC